VNTTTPRVFIAATRQNDGKTTTSLGLIAALQQSFPRVGYIKPVGQRFVEIEEQKIDEDTVLMDAVYRLNTPLVDMSPIAVEPDFTRKYLLAANNDALIKKIQKAFDRVSWEKDFVLRRQRPRRRRFRVRFVQRPCRQIARRESHHRFPGRHWQAD
jgi:BioD-like phosphotransacetylase family protein